MLDDLCIVRMVAVENLGILGHSNGTVNGLLAGEIARSLAGREEGVCGMEVE